MWHHYNDQQKQTRNTPSYKTRGHYKQRWVSTEGVIKAILITWNKNQKFCHDFSGKVAFKYLHIHGIFFITLRALSLFQYLIMKCIIMQNSNIRSLMHYEFLIHSAHLVWRRRSARLCKQYDVTPEQIDMVWRLHSSCRKHGAAQQTLPLSCWLISTNEAYLEIIPSEVHDLHNNLLSVWNFKSATCSTEAPGTDTAWYTNP